MMTWTPEETKEHRRLWVEALRSGKYKQGQSVLRNPDNAMCCLGVACEISGLVRWSETPVGLDSSIGYEAVNDERDFSRFYAPAPVVEWLGLAADSGKFGDTSLAAMNDDGTPFSAIADIIESEPEGLLAPVAGLERVG
jgi:hypothetical protein